MEKIDRLEIKCSITILKPTSQVFEAIVDPARMSNYFIASGSGRMEQGRTLNWKFPEFEDIAQIEVVRVEDGSYVSFYWQGAPGSEKTLVELVLQAGNADSTLVTVIEKSLPHDEAGIKWLKGNTEGWANFLACLKAYVEYGINLRKGAFEHLRPK